MVWVDVLQNTRLVGQPADHCDQRVMADVSYSEAGYKWNSLGVYTDNALV